MKSLRIIISILFALQMNLSSFAQVGARLNCSENLRKATIAYDNGLIQTVPDLLLKCLPGYSKVQKTQAYRLLILSYIFDNKPDLADKYMQALLRFDPLYIVQDEEPVEFRNLFGLYRTEPVYSLGIMAGGVLSFADMMYPFSTSDLNSTKTYFNTLPSFEIMAYFNSYITDNIKLNLTLNLTQNRFNINQDILDFSRIKLTENLISTGLGIAGTYEFRKVRKTIIKPYITIGIEPNYLIFAAMTAQRIYTDDSKPLVEDQGINTLAIRRKFNVAPYISTGVKYRIGKAWLIADIKYSHNILSTNNTANRFSNDNLMFKYYYIDSDFAMQHFCINIGIIQSFYNPIKK
jgi:outer membrane protein W